jgi:vacuolar-type H+-ATPase subunit H
MSSIERNAQALIDLVRDAATARREALLGAARDEAARLVREAHAEARRRLRSAFGDARKRGRDRIDAARAMLETRRRQSRQRHSAALLAAAWQRLPGALEARWRDDRARADWVSRTLAEARLALPAQRWRIVHPADWAGAERDALVAAVHAATGVAPDLVADATLAAGLALAADGTTVDATLASLLADRAELGAMLLERLEDEPSPGASA